jgi:tetratricopeptide (TPR) repeat protein
MTFAVLVAAAGLAAVAAAGVLHPFGRGRALAAERLADPLEDERDSLLRSLRDLDEERANGELEDGAYRALRTETETRAVAVVRALEARDGAGTLVDEIRSVHRRSPLATDAMSGNGSEPKTNPERGRRRRKPVAVGAVALAAAAVAGVLLSAAVRTRAPGQPITGGVGVSNPIAFFEQRVADHPNDVAARLDLAQQYEAAGNAQGAIEQYLATLKIDPRNAEAHAELGFILFWAGKPEDGLRAVQQALDVQPDYPQALYYKGVILLRGLKRPADAADAFRAYLAAAPYGALRAQVEDLLKQTQT